MRWHYDWLAYLEGEMQPQKRSEAEEHLKGCAECREAVRVLKLAFEAISREAERTKDCPDPELLWRYSEGELSEAESREIEDHLASCSLCLAEVEALKAVHPEPARVGLKKVLDTILSSLDRIAAARPGFAFAKLAERAKGVAVERLEIPEITVSLKGMKITLVPQKDRIVADVEGEPEEAGRMKLTLTDDLGAETTVSIDKAGNYAVEIDGRRVRIYVELKGEGDGT